MTQSNARFYVFTALNHLPEVGSNTGSGDTEVKYYILGNVLLKFGILLVPKGMEDKIKS